jgi:predicted nucleotidyltransferase component of viral defense system
VSKLDNSFYLTGGTALHRFYYDCRYSDDLDLFSTNSDNFYEDVNEFYEEILKEFKVLKSVSSRDFYRFIVNDSLQVDLVNDRVYRYKKSLIIDNIRVDNKINILTNKINAIVSRDEEKDFYDLFCLSFYEDFNWKDILEIANKKAPLQKDILLYRLKTFPFKWLDKIKYNKHKIDITKNHLKILYNDVLKDSNNSLKLNKGV